MQTPLFIAEHSCHARGFIGSMIAKWMAFATAGANEKAVSLLDIQNGEKVLDFGTGHGRTLGLIHNRTPNGLTVGLDNSPIMIKEAIRRNKTYIENDTMEIYQSHGALLKFSDGYFDKALMVHSCYFLHPLEEYFAEMKRVLKKNGVFVVCFQRRRQHRPNTLPDEVYRLRTAEEMKVLLWDAGFTLTEEAVLEKGNKPLVWLKVEA
ncbi:class I SAM-dependent methyltransferase [Kordiimonas laminariae]|uniref:class I SAM-dependent methyltransferase n=1 Tax=Kordiimonas laminariae TaxID=2917717 RepID=UPI001FF25C10|nr:class I SAM-dependent methyltransferase [Kordiimonas laminariae]MCK0068713.1 class I SAM-dependent methyltransferase [Kordiimonas laminariae]